MTHHETQTIGNTPEMAQPATPLFFGPILSDEDGDAQGDLAPAKGILVSLFIGGVMWLLIIYLLSRVS
jgi:hypothetical protein